MLSNNMESEEDQQTIEEEYKIWKTNCNFLYDRIHSQVSTWPYLTVQWLPELYGYVAPMCSQCLRS